MDIDLLRYSCQMALPGFSKSAQLLLQEARVLVVGAGGLGCPAAQYLTAAGIGTLGIADFDAIAISNLHRQVLFNPADVGKKKAVVACQRLQLQNPGIKLVPHDKKITSYNVADIIAHYDMVVDCTDNFDTRYLLNDACVLSGKPVVYGAIYQFEGQVATWNLPHRSGLRTPNYRDLYPKVDATQIPNCAEGGVIPTLAGIIGCMQANEVLKYITQTGEVLAGKVLIFDAQSMQSRIIKIGDVTHTDIKTLTHTFDVPTISIAGLKIGLAEGSIELIDIRDTEERDAFHIGGKHIPLEKIYEHMAHIPANTKTVLYCASGKRSGEAIKLIKKNFPDANVFSLEGGVKGWLAGL
jgi:molybdopterin/thiamine biosynthesis adenylyltransferase/rhodanese-related sulfurtransferase